MGNEKEKGQGHNPVKGLQFSKSCKAEIERAYTMYYLDEKRIAELKAGETGASCESF